MKLKKISTALISKKPIVMLIGLLGLAVLAGCGGNSVGNSNDSTSPNLSNGAPVGVLSAGTPSALLSVTTDVDAICKYDTASGVDYSAMANTFSTSGGVNPYNRYLRLH